MKIIQRISNSTPNGKHIHFFLLLSFLFFTQSLRADKHDISNSFHSNTRKIEEYGLSDASKAKSLLDSLYHVASRSPEVLRLQAQCLYWETSIASDQGHYDSTLIHRIKNMADLLDNTTALFEQALLKLALSLTYLNKGDYGQSFTIGLQTLEQFKKLENNQFISKTLYLLGNICSYIKSYDMAEDYYNQSIALAETPKNKHRIRLNIYSVWGLFGRVEKAIDSLSTWIPVLEQERDTAMLVMAYTHLGACYAIHQEQKKTDAHYQIAFSLIPAIKNNSLVFSLYQNMGVYCLSMQQWEQALGYFNEAKRISVANDNMEQLSFSYVGLAKAYECMGKADSALNYLNLYNELNNNQINKTKALDVYRAYIAESLASTQKELTIAQQEIELKSKQFVITVGFSIGIILLVSLGLIVIQLRKHIKDVENKKLEEELRIKRRLEELQEERIEVQIRELTSNSLMLSAKNNILQQIADLAKHLPPDLDEVQSINQIIKSNMNTDDAWANFMLHFEKVHPVFFNKLKGMNKDFTNNDLQFCAYLRFGMSSKQIAQILNISYGSIRNHRSRIKKKLNLKEDEKLDKLIMSL